METSIKSLSQRNEQLVQTIALLRESNRTLLRTVRRQNALLLRLSIKGEVKNDKYTQTTLDDSPRSPQSLTKLKFMSPVPKQYCTSPFSLTTKTAMNLSPAMERVQLQLINRLRDGHDIDFEMKESSLNRRTPRSVKKIINYKEPSLVTKIRRGRNVFK